MVTEDYVSFETAKLLKEKWFDGKCHAFYRKTLLNNKITDKAELHISTHLSLTNGNLQDKLYKEIVYCVAPTLQMAMKWLREEKGVAVIPVLSSVLDNEKFLWDIKIVVAKTGESYSQGWIYEKQEAACDTAIQYCLENLV